MYNRLYEVWKHELEIAELGSLPPDFYSRIADFLRRLKEESRMLDKRTVKAKLLQIEMRNVKRMIHELIRVRHEKLIMKVMKGERISPDALTAEEKKISMEISHFAEVYPTLTEDILRGHMPRVDVKTKHRRIALRFLKDVPAIIGADMEAYGPFKGEDIASLPIENAKILAKQGLAEKIEVN